MGLDGFEGFRAGGGEAAGRGGVGGVVPVHDGGQVAVADAVVEGAQLGVAGPFADGAEADLEELEELVADEVADGEFVFLAGGNVVAIVEEVELEEEHFADAGKLKRLGRAQRAVRLQRRQDGLQRLQQKRHLGRAPRVVGLEHDQQQVGPRSEQRQPRCGEQLLPVGEGQKLNQ